jgi:hypothetical protein
MKGDASCQHASPLSRQKETRFVDLRLLCLDERGRFLWTHISYVSTKGDALFYTRLIYFDDMRHELWTLSMKGDT